MKYSKFSVFLRRKEKEERRRRKGRTFPPSPPCFLPLLEKTPDREGKREKRNGLCSKYGFI